MRRPAGRRPAPRRRKLTASALDYYMQRETGRRPSSQIADVVIERANPCQLECTSVGCTGAGNVGGTLAAENSDTRALH